METDSSGPTEARLESPESLDDLRRLRATNRARGLPAYVGAQLAREQVRILIAEAQDAYPEYLPGDERPAQSGILDLRGVDLAEADLSSLRLAGAWFGPVHAPSDGSDWAIHCAHLERAHLNACDLTGAVLAGAHLDGADLTGAMATGVRAHGAHLVGAVLAHAVFDRADLSAAELHGANLDEGSFNHADLRGAQLQVASLLNSSLSHATLVECNLSSADLSFAHLAFANLAHAQLENARLAGANLSNTILAHANLARANLVSAILNRATLEHAHLPHAHLAGARLHRANLNQANLWHAIAPSATFTDADLRWADLRGAILMSAHLAHANLGNTDLRDADLRGAQLEGTVLTGAKVDHANLIGAQCDHRTHWPGLPFQGVLVCGVRWDGANLADVPWERIRKLGDEDVALDRRKVSAGLRPRALRKAANAYRELALALGREGHTGHSADYRYRQHLMERWSLLYEMGNRLCFVADGTDLNANTFAQRARRFAALPAVLLRWLLSFLLGALSGYGNKPGRAITAYVCIISLFTALYALLASTADHPLTLLSALVLSVTSFHGRGFFPQDVHPYDPLAVLAALEAVVGMFIELLFISAFTRRLFGA